MWLGVVQAFANPWTSVRFRYAPPELISNYSIYLYFIWAVWITDHL